MSEEEVEFPVLSQDSDDEAWAYLMFGPFEYDTEEDVLTCTICGSQQIDSVNGPGPEGEPFKSAECRVCGRRYEP